MTLTVDDVRVGDSVAVCIEGAPVVARVARRFEVHRSVEVSLPPRRVGSMRVLASTTVVPVADVLEVLR